MATLFKLAILALYTTKLLAAGPGGGPEPLPAPFQVLSLEPAMKACKEIAAATGDPVEYQGSKAYAKENRRYWSAASADLKPACIVFPSHKETVSKAVQVLLQNPSVQWAVKSGGHMPNPTFNSVAGGVLIAFSGMAKTYYDPTDNIALVEPGARWGEVVSALAPYGVTVVGGRIADVGTGLLLGGGMSFLTTQRGLASSVSCNSLSLSDELERQRIRDGLREWHHGQCQPSIASRSLLCHEDGRKPIWNSNQIFTPDLPNG
jgi:hypothetical protein